MKIKLKRELWNAKKGDVIEETEERAKWAIDRGLAEAVKPSPEPKPKKDEAKSK